MLGWILNGKSITNEHALAMLCNECPCKIDFEVCGSRDCGCFSGGINMGPLSGRFRITYISGAIRTREDYKWNFEGRGYCRENCEQPCFCVFLGGKQCPGFTANGFDSSEEAEAYGKGKQEIMEFDGARNIFLRFSDDVCSDTEGCIVYRIVKETNTTEVERMVSQLPEALQ